MSRKCLPPHFSFNSCASRQRMAELLVFLSGFLLLLGTAASQNSSAAASATVPSASPTPIPNPTPSQEPTTEVTTATIEPVTQGPMDVCIALEQIAISAFQNNVTCFTNLNCDGLECILTPLGPSSRFLATALMLPCLDPPAVQLNLKGSDGSTVFDEIVVRSTIIEMFGIAVNVTLDQLPMENAVGFQIEVQNPLSSGGTDVIFPYGKIPIDKSRCPTTTCGALQLISLSRNVANNVSCVTNVDCNGLECLVDVFGTGVQFPVLATVMPCNQPPAIHLVVNEPGGKLISQQITSKNSTIKLFNFEVRVRLDQLQYAIGLRVDGVNLQHEPESTERIIEYTRIPIDTTDCPPDSSSSGVTAHLIIIAMLLATSLLLTM